MVWRDIPSDYTTAPVLGNGTFGTWFWQEKEQRLVFEISRQDVYDHRNSYSGKPGMDDILYSKCRLPNGQFWIPYKGKAKKADSERMTCKIEKGELGAEQFYHIQLGDGRKFEYGVSKNKDWFCYNGKEYGKLS